VDISEIEVRLGAADLMARYQFLADTGRVEELSQLFLPDAEFVNNSATHVGPEQVLAFFLATGTAFQRGGLLPGRHHLSSILVTPQPDGTARTYAAFAFVGRHGPDHWGSYRDVVEQVDGAWRFRRRKAIIDGLAAHSPVRDLLHLVEM
jgi:hypothetical protein